MRNPAVSRNNPEGAPSWLITGGWIVLLVIGCMGQGTAHPAAPPSWHIVRTTIFDAGQVGAVLAFTKASDRHGLGAEPLEHAPGASGAACGIGSESTKIAIGSEPTAH